VPGAQRQDCKRFADTTSIGVHVVARIALLSAMALAVLAVCRAPTAAAEGMDRTLMVTLVPGASHDAAEQLFAESGLQVLDRMSPLSVYRVAVETDGDAGSIMDALRESPLVRAAEMEGEQAIQLVPNDALYAPFQWNLPRISMEQAWDLRPSASEVIVAVLDTGVDLTHPDLLPNLLVDQGYDFLNDSPTAQDDQSHGTAVAGIIGALGDNEEGVAGIAWRVKILPIKALSDQGRGPESAMVKAILHAVDKGAQIINISSTGARYSAALETAVAYAQDKGALVVAAAGNTGDGDNAVNYPAAFDGVVAVAAIDRRDQLAPFSQRRSYVVVAAPGVDVPSTAWSGAGRGPYASQSGTSIAAPHVSGVAALLWAMRPDLTAAQIADILRSSAERVPAARTELGYGAGVLNAARAVAGVRLGVRPDAPGSVSLTVDQPPIRAIPPPSPLPADQRRWYFAEGSTQAPFELSFALYNPNPRPTVAHFLFLSSEGKQTPFDLLLGPDSRATLNANEVLPDAEFSTIVTTDQPVYVERSMYFGHDGHSATGARQPSQSWYLAEGATVPPFETWILLLNPNPVATTARLRFMREDGSIVGRMEALPAMGRRSVFVNALFAAAGFATQVAADQPIVVERATYFDARQGGHNTLAAATPGRTWYLAAGSSHNDFDTWLLLQNPGDQPASVRVSFLTDVGTVINQSMFVLPHARASLLADPLVPDAAFGMWVESDQPIVAERAVYFDEGRAGFSATAVAAPATEWFLPDGATTGSFIEQLAIINPRPEVSNVQLDFQPALGERPPSKRFSIGPNSRLTLDINPEVPDSSVSLRVVADRPIVVERTSYFARPTGVGATSSTGLTR